MTEPEGRRVLVINGRILEVTAYHSSGPPRLENTVAWWGSLVLLGGMLLVLSGFAAAGWGARAAVGGVVLFLVTAVLAGTERYEFATAAGVAALLWTSAGVAVLLEIGGPPVDWFVAFAAAGAALALMGTAGTVRLRSGESDRTAADS